MNFNLQLLGTLRLLLFPFSLIYYIIIWIRNRLYDMNRLQSVTFNLPIICIGNLSMGGTGKSPMVEYLIKMLSPEIQVATLSRGYKRKTKGYALADANSTALEIGDEPMQFHNKFPGIAVSVGEERLEAIPQLLHDRPDTRVILLDDAFQHRQVKAGYNILLVDHSNLFTRDWYLPTGDLRDEKKSYKRADLIVVTKCQESMSLEEKESIVRELNPLDHQEIFFSTIRYGLPYHIVTKDTCTIGSAEEVLLVTGIANPAPLKHLLNKTTKTYEQLTFRDHQVFTIDDLKDIIARFDAIRASRKIILTTEKDAVRLVKFETVLKDIPLFVIPIATEFMFNGAAAFEEKVQAFINNFYHTAQ